MKEQQIPLSKEDILRDRIFEVESPMGATYPVTSTEDAEVAMDEWAKIEAIAFAEWIKDNHYTKNINKDEETRWYKYFEIREDFPAGFSMSSGVSKYFTSDELYTLFKEQSYK